MSITYKDAGVNIDEGNKLVDLIRESAASTFSPAVLTGLGSFGAFFDLSEIIKEYRHPVLVQSVDGVGTKTIIARKTGDFTRIGEDLVSACSNDIAVHGARPLTMLDYIANDRLDAQRSALIVEGIARGCREIGASLIGGETAEMPGTYLPGEHDLVGLITGIVDRDKIINGKDVTPGDMVIGLHSSGLHTNGFSLARKIIEQRDISLDEPVPGSREPLYELLLKAHFNYTPGIQRALALGVPITAMAHITGGGLPENVPRVLPGNCDAVIDCSTWETPPVFTFLQEMGQVSRDEMYRTFNMGIGLVIIVKESASLEQLIGCFYTGVVHIGRIAEGSGKVRLENSGRQRCI